MITAISVKPAIADPELAPVGRARVEWAEGQMPVLRSIRERFEAEQPLAGVRVAACLHVTAETANLMQALVAGGAEVALCSANPLTIQDEVAAALVGQALADRAQDGHLGVGPFDARPARGRE
ncbi:MAG TPA: adenosylhomocysteinase [Thermoleophilaceae bacterium]